MAINSAYLPVSLVEDEGCCLTSHSSAGMSLLTDLTANCAICFAAVARTLLFEPVSSRISNLSNLHSGISHDGECRGGQGVGTGIFFTEVGAYVGA